MKILCWQAEVPAVKDMLETGILDTYLGKYWAIKLATNAAVTVLRVDQVSEKWNFGLENNFHMVQWYIFMELEHSNSSYSTQRDIPLSSSERRSSSLKNIFIFLDHYSFKLFRMYFNSFKTKTFVVKETFAIFKLETNLDS